MLKTEITKGQVQTVGKNLSGIATSLRDFRVPFFWAKEDVAAGFAAIFSSQGAVIGQRWPSLSAAYAARKPGGRGLLELTGKLRSGLTSRLSARIAKKTARYGTSTPYAGAVTWGSPKQRIPARIIALWPDTTSTKVTGRIDAYVDQVITARGMRDD